MMTFANIIRKNNTNNTNKNNFNFFKNIGYNTYTKAKE